MKREVYEKQISRSPISADLRDRSKEQIYSDTLGQSLFSLCPSGTGPNTIRLWESIHALSIPVVLSNRWDPPGPQDLWQQCSFRFDEKADVHWIWNQLHAASLDHTQLARMIQALIDLRSYYSHNYLAADLATLLLSPASHSPDQSTPAATQPEASHTPFNDPELQPYCTIFLGRHWSAEQLQSPWVDPGFSLHAHDKPILPYALVKQSRLAVELVKRLSWILRQHSPASLLADWQTRPHQVLPPEDAALIGEQPGHEASFAQDLRRLSHTRNAVLVDSRHDRGPDASGMKQATLALAMAALPIVHWSPDSPALDYFQAEAVVNLHGLDTDAAAELIAAFQPTLDHAEAFLETCRFNLKLLRSFRVHSLSRRRLARNLWQQVSSCVVPPGCSADKGV